MTPIQSIQTPAAYAVGSSGSQRFTEFSCLALLADLYELTMAQGYWRSGLAERESVFHMFFRKHPFQGGFTVAAGLAPLVSYLSSLRFSEEDLAYLSTLLGNDRLPIFEPAFLGYLRRFELACDIDAVPEGTVVFPQEPLLRVEGPLLQAQILESAILNFLNFQSLVATKAARIAHVAARGEQVLEFGLRRAHGIDGAMAASRAAFIGGCSATSNVLAGKTYGIPLRGTHAHSWVMCFGSEIEAFQAYAEAMPNYCVFLVDTYDTLDGVHNAVQIGRWLRSRGHELVGIRLDSGDLAHLSIEARRILDEAGFPKAIILASNEIDEHVITSLKSQGAMIGVWGVGTRLVTGHGESALGGVYKLGAIRDPASPDADALGWRYTLKVSEQAFKISNPGVLQVRRFFGEPYILADAIYHVHEPAHDAWVLVDPLDPTRRRVLTADTPAADLLVPIYRKGRLVYDVPTLAESRARTADQIEHLPPPHLRLMNPQPFPVGLEASLHDRKTRLVLRARGFES
jgi:nicotinate phosphoribosyltransferase